MHSAEGWAELLLRATAGGLRLTIDGARATADGVRPIAGALQHYVTDAERSVIHVIRDHINDLESLPAEAVDPEVDDPAPPSTTRLLQSLFQRSIEESPGDSKRTFYDAILTVLLPDEARILAAVAEGGPYAVVHVGTQGVGASSELILENASSVGRAAGVSLTQYTPRYVTRMQLLGLVTIGPEDTSIRDDYELLVADAPVRAAIAEASRGLQRARTIRKSLRISDLGRDLWEAANC